MNLWVLLVAVPVAVSTVVAVSACMLSSRCNRSLEMPEYVPDSGPVVRSHRSGTAPQVTSIRR